MFSIAQRIGVHAAAADNTGNLVPDAEPTHVMALFADTGRARIFPHLQRHGWRFDPDPDATLPPPWTDRYSNLLRSLR